MTICLSNDNISKIFVGLFNTYSTLKISLFINIVDKYSLHQLTLSYYNSRHARQTRCYEFLKVNLSKSAMHLLFRKKPRTKRLALGFSGPFGQLVNGSLGNRQPTEARGSYPNDPKNPNVEGQYLVFLTFMKCMENTVFFPSFYRILWLFSS